MSAHAGPQVWFRAEKGGPAVHMVFPVAADPFEICNHARARIFPDVAMIPAAMTPPPPDASKPKRRRAA